VSSPLKSNSFGHEFALGQDEYEHVIPRRSRATGLDRVFPCLTACIVTPTRCWRATCKANRLTSRKSRLGYRDARRLDLAGSLDEQAPAAGCRCGKPPLGRERLGASPRQVCDNDCSRSTLGWSNAIQPSACFCHVGCFGCVSGVCPSTAEAPGVFPVYDRRNMAGVVCAWAIESACTRFSYLSHFCLPCHHFN